MCVGIPMQVIAIDGLTARCAGRKGQTAVDVSLVSDAAPGDWVLVFLGAAREIISEDAARVTSDAIAALELVMRGETDIDHLFADLIDREPQLPHHLRPKQKTA